MTTDERKDYLDIAKGIGIVLVVWAHAGGPFTNYINSFHMPFFFFISGMLFVPEKKQCSEYIIGKCKSLLVPFWGWNLLLYPIFFLLYYWGEWPINVLVTEVGEILLTVDKVPFLGATWFLASMFWISVSFKCLHFITSKVKKQDCLLLLSGIGLCIIGFMVTLPYRQSRTLICSLFYICGYLYVKYLHERIKRYRSILMLVSCIGYCWVVSINDCNLADNMFESKVLFILGAFLGIYLTVSVSMYFEDYKNAIWSKVLIYLGKNTLPIVIWHFLAFRITIILQIAVLGVDIKELVDFPIYNSENGWWVLYIIFGICGSLIWKLILEHNCFSQKLKRIHLI